MCRLEALLAAYDLHGIDALLLAIQSHAVPATDLIAAARPRILIVDDSPGNPEKLFVINERYK